MSPGSLDLLINHISHSLKFSIPIRFSRQVTSGFSEQIQEKVASKVKDMGSCVTPPPGQAGLHLYSSLDSAVLSIEAVKRFYGSLRTSFLKLLN